MRDSRRESPGPFFEMVAVHLAQEVEPVMLALGGDVSRFGQGREDAAIGSGALAFTIMP